MDIEKPDWMIYGNILMSILTPYEWLIHEGFLYVTHDLKRFKKRKELMACYSSICLFWTKRNWFAKKRYDFKMKRDGPTCSTEKDCSSHLYDSNLFKSIDSWTYVLYRKDCSSHLYDSGLLYIVLVCGPLWFHNT